MATNSATAIGSRAELPLWIRDDTIAGRGLHRDGESVCLAQGATMATMHNGSTARRQGNERAARPGDKET